MNSTSDGCSMDEDADNHACFSVILCAHSLYHHFKGYTASPSHTHTANPSYGMPSASIFSVIITRRSLSLWVVCTHDLWKEKVWTPSDKACVICSEWMNIMAGLCPVSGPGHGREDDNKSTPCSLDALWCLKCYCPCQGYKTGSEIMMHAVLSSHEGEYYSVWMDRSALSRSLL